MNRNQRKMQEKYLKEMERGTWVDQKPDPDDEKYVLIAFRIPNGGMPVARHEGKYALDRLERFCRGFTAGIDDARRGVPYRRGDPAHLRAALGGTAESWWQRLLQSNEVERGCWWTQRPDPANQQFVLVEMRMPAEGGTAMRFTGIEARRELERFCRARLGAVADAGETN